MKIRHKDSGEDKVELQMTPMIDIVFQLLVFFILTFNVVAQEGDFSIRMPAMSKPAESLDKPEMTTLKVHLEAISSGKYAGELKRLKLNEEVLFEGGGSVRKAFDTLHARILKKVDDAGGPSKAASLLEVEFNCDYNLKYNNVIEAITAVSGKLVEGDKISRLIEKIKFAHPEKTPDKIRFVVARSREPAFQYWQGEVSRKRRATVRRSARRYWASTE